MLHTILLTVIAVLLYSYSILRYLDLWKRGKASPVFFVLIHVLSLIIGSAVIMQWAGRISDVFILAGSAYITVYSAIMLLTPVFCFLRGILRFFGKRLQWRGKLYRFINHPTKLILCFLLLSAIAGAYGLIHERTVKRTEYKVMLDKEAAVDEVAVVILSDLRVGSRMTQGELSELTAKINEAGPDVVLFCGNTLGSGATEQMVEETIDKLQKLTAADGVYLTEGTEDAAILARSEEKFEKKGLHLLWDDCIFLNNGLQLVGCREKGNGERKPLAETMSLLNPDRPSIVFAYDKIEDDILSEKKVDLVVSSGAGETYGWDQKGTTKFLCTAGVRAGVLPGKYIVPSEFVKLTLR